jgi:mono/diheme cytochrome c family protein
MAVSRSTRSSSGSAFGIFLLGIVFTLVALFAGAYFYFHYGHPPVATADAPFPFEQQIVKVPLGARIQSQIQEPPFGTSEQVFESGAQMYADSCASCHGVPGHDTAFAKYMYPVAPQLWRKHPKGSVVGVSDDDAGETYWKIAHGIRLTGMPAFDHLYSSAQMWQIALLLKNADQPMPDPVMKLLETPANASPGPSMPALQHP